jgi:O-antigen/teichoic acid export membrane protein
MKIETCGALVAEKPVRAKPSFLSSVATVLGGQAACAALALITEICYARLLGPAGRGQISLCMMLIGIGVLVGGLGGVTPIVVWTADTRRKPAEWLPVVLLLGVTGSLIACGLGASIFWHWHLSALRTITTPLAVLILLTIPAAIFSGYLLAILAGSEQFRVRAGVSLADQFSGLAGFLLLLLFLGPKAESAVLGNLVGIVIGGAIVFFLLRDIFPDTWKIRRPDPEIIAGVRMGLRGQPGNMATALYYRFDVFLVSFFLGPAQVGLYALAVVISEALWQIPQAVSWAIFPRTARTMNQGAAEFTCLVIRQVFAISCLSGIALAAVSPFAVPLVFGEAFRPSVASIWWLIPGTISLSLAKVASADLAARSKTGYSTIFAIIALAVSVPLDLLLIPRMGIRGASLTSSVVYATDTVLLLAALKHVLKVTWKTLLVPSAADFELYRQGWAQGRSWVRSVLVPVPRAGESS